MSKRSEPADVSKATADALMRSIALLIERVTQLEARVQILETRLGRELQRR